MPDPILRSKKKLTIHTVMPNIQTEFEILRHKINQQLKRNFYALRLDFRLLNKPIGAYHISIRLYKRLDLISKEKLEKKTPPQYLVTYIKNKKTFQLNREKQKKTEKLIINELVSLLTNISKETNTVPFPLTLTNHEKIEATLQEQYRNVCIEINTHLKKHNIRLQPQKYDKQSLTTFSFYKIKLDLIPLTTNTSNCSLPEKVQSYYNKIVFHTIGITTPRTDLVNLNSKQKKLLSLLTKKNTPALTKKRMRDSDTATILAQLKTSPIYKPKQKKKQKVKKTLPKQLIRSSR